MKKVQIDTRPLLIVMLSRWWRFPVYLLMGLAMKYFYQHPPPDGLSPEGYRALAVYLICIILWTFHLLPLAITGLFALIAPALMGVMSAKQAFSFFGSEPVFFILGVFILAAALLKSGLSTRMALFMLRRAGHSPRRLILQILMTAGLLSFIMSEHAVAAMMFPLVVVVAQALEFIPNGGSYGRLLFLAMAWGCIVGGIATMLGGGRVPLAVGIMQEAGYPPITFLEWSVAVIPIVVILFVTASLVLTRCYRVDVATVAEADRIITEKHRAMGRPHMEEQFLLALTIGAILAWMFFGQTIGMAPIAILVVVLLFMFRVVEWKDLEQNVDWGIILMYGGAIGLSSILNSTGAGAWLAKSYLVPYITSPWALIGIVAFVSILLTEAVSNSAVVAALLPTVLSLGPAFGLEPRVCVFLVASAAGLGFILPMSTPSIALVYSSRFVGVRDVIGPGLILNLASWIALMLTAKFWWPVLGIKIL